MSEWFPKIVLIEDITSHPKAHSLDIARVLGDYPVIIKKGEFNVGDLASYIPIDTILPDIEIFYNLSPKKYETYIDPDGSVKNKQVGFKYDLGSVPESKRVLKAKKILDVYSQGLLIKPIEGLSLGDSIVDVLSLKKQEEQEEENVPRAKKSIGANAGTAPSGWSIPYYDIGSIRSHIKVVENDQDIVLTEKIHGSNFSCCFDNNENKLFVKSRRFYKKRDEQDLWWDAAIRLNLEEKIKKYPMLVFFGELTGAVKNFTYGCEVVDGCIQTDVYFFDIYDLKQKRFLDYDLFSEIIKDLGLKQTPLIYRGPWTNKEDMYSKAEIKTNLGQKHIAEGWVIRPAVERYLSNFDRVQFKYISQQYNLSK